MRRGSAQRMTLAAVARGEIRLARALGAGAREMEALRSLAVLLRRAGRLEAHRALLEGMIALEPSDDWAHGALVEAALDVGDLGAARAAASRAEALGRERGAVTAEIALLIGRVLLADGRRAEARVWLEFAARSGQGEAGEVATRICARLPR